MTTAIAAIGIAAAVPAAAAPYSLRQAHQDAQARHPLVAASMAERAAAGHSLEAAKWARWPSFSTDLANGSGESARVVRIDQPLWTGGRITGQIDNARAQESGAAHAETEARRQLAEQVAVAYLGWLGAERRLVLATDGSALFQRLLETVRRREAAGAAAQSDVSIALGRAAAAAAQREQLAAELERARAELQSLVVGTVGAAVDVDVADFRADGAEDVETRALADAPTLAKRRADVEAAYAAREVASALAWPTLGLRVEHVNNRGGPGQPTSDTRVQLTLQYVPGAGLAAGSAADAARSKVVAAQEQLRATEVDLRLRARALWLEHASVQRQLVELKPQTDALAATADSYLRQFEAGRRGWIEVLNVYREALDARIALSRLQTQRAQSALRLMANTGELLSWIETTSP